MSEPYEPNLRNLLAGVCLQLAAWLLAVADRLATPRLRRYIDRELAMMGSPTDKGGRRANGPTRDTGKVVSDAPQA